MPELTVNGVAIDDTFAEAFDMRATAIVITAPTARWATQAATTMTGFATSVIGCGCEAGVDEHAVAERNAGRTAGRARADVCGLDRGTAEATAEPRRPMRAHQPGLGLLRGLGLGRRTSSSSATPFATSATAGRSPRRLGDRRYWRVPVMDGEFVCESTTYLTKSAVGGGNLIVMGETPEKTLAATEAAVKAMREVAGRHHAVSRRHCALGVEGRLEIQGRHRLDQPFLLPDAEGRGRQRHRARDRLGLGDRH